MPIDALGHRHESPISGEQIAPRIGSYTDPEALEQIQTEP